MRRRPLAALRLGLAALACGLASLAGPAPAQSFSDPGFGVGGHVLYVSEVGRSEGDGFAFGVHSRYRLTGGLGLEVALDARLATYDLDGEKAFRLLVVPLTGTFQLFLLPRARLQPYLAAGAGYYFIRGRGYGPLEGLGAQTENRFGFHGGIGVDVRPSRASSVHLEVRYVILESDVIPDGGSPTVFSNVTPSADYWSTAAGVTLYF